MFANLFNFHLTQLHLYIRQTRQLPFILWYIAVLKPLRKPTRLNLLEYNNCNNCMLCAFVDIWSLLVVMEQFVFGSGIYPPLNLSKYMYMYM